MRFLMEWIRSYTALYQPRTQMNVVTGGWEGKEIRTCIEDLNLVTVQLLYIFNLLSCVIRVKKSQEELQLGKVHILRKLPHIMIGSK